MDKENRLAFVTFTEKKVTPQKIATTFQGAEFLRKLPLKLQKKLMEKGAKTNPYMSFIVDPYSIFFAYEIIDTERVKNMLPSEYELLECSMFESGEKKPCMILGAFNVHTSVFSGNRVEAYIIARNKKTGLTSWLIDEYETNTISYDPGRGFIKPSARHAILTTTCLGELVLDVEGENPSHKIQAQADLKQGIFQKLDQNLWVEGNLSVDYSSELSDIHAKPFGLIFDPLEMEQAMSIPMDAISITTNEFLANLIAKSPYEVCCFPYAQHFYTTSIPMEHEIKTRNDLEQKILEIIKEPHS